MTDKENSILLHNQSQHKIWLDEQKHASVHEVHFRTDDLSIVYPIIFYANGLNREKGDDVFYWCGYVGVPENHCLFSASLDWGMDGLESIYGVCHGGITFAGRQSLIPNHNFIGFDCAHSGDFMKDEHKDNKYELLNFVTKNKVFDDCINLVKFLSGEQKLDLTEKAKSKFISDNENIIKITNKGEDNDQ
jgi:hypothetical protein